MVSWAGAVSYLYRVDVEAAEYGRRDWNLSPASTTLDGKQAVQRVCWSGGEECTAAAGSIRTCMGRSNPHGWLVQAIAFQGSCLLGCWAAGVGRQGQGTWDE